MDFLKVMFERVEEKFRQVVDATPNGMLMVGPDGKIVMANAQAEKLFGYDRNELLGQSVELLVPERFRAQHPQHRASYFASPQVRAMGAGRDLYGQRKDGTEFPVEIGLNPLPDGREGFVLASVIDITERKRVEAGLAEQVRTMGLRAALGETLARGTDLRETLQQCAETVVQHLDVAFARIWTLNQQENVLELQASAGLYTHLDGPHRRVPVGSFKIGRIAQNKQPHLTNDVLHDPNISNPDWAAREGMVAFAGYPLLVEDRVAGVLALFARQVLAENVLHDLASCADVLAQFIERKRAETALRQSEERMRLILDMALEAVIVMDEHGIITEWNPQAEAIFGWRREEALGRALADTIIPPAQREAHHRGLRQFLTTGIGPVLNRRIEVSAQHRSGHEFPAELTITPIRWEGHFAFSGFLRDISERKRAEEQLREHDAELARSNAELEQFAYVASHDLQEPLRMVASFLQLLAQRYQGQLDAKADQYIQFAVDGAARMKTLIENLLAYSRAGRKDLAPAPTDCTRVLAQAVTNLRQAIQERGALVTHDPLPTVLGSASQLTQVFQNLVSNAIKFGKPGESPHVHVGAQLQDREWVFAVSDNGIGIAPEHRERIFLVFQRLHTRDQYPGTGIGLAICKKVIERHGGRIWVESGPGMGSVFYFTLPATGRSNPEREGAPAGAQALTRTGAATSARKPDMKE